MPEPDADDRGLVEAAQRDPSRFADLYERHFERVYAFVVRRVRDRDVAEDVTAEVFHRALASLPKYEWRGAPFGAWLFRIASNAIEDRFKRSAREDAAPADVPDRSVFLDVEHIDLVARLFHLCDAAPRLRVKNAAAAIDFYTRAFGARELMRFEGHGRIAHAELEIGNAIFMLGEEAPEYGFPGPEALGGSPVAMHLQVDDADRWMERAVAAGARLVTPPTDQFYGDRVGHVADPFGYGWDITERKADLSVEEMHRRMAALEAQQSAGRTAPTFIREGLRTVTPDAVA